MKREFLQKIHELPFHQFCGFQTVRQEAGRAVCRFPVNRNTANAFGLLHGGILYGLMDLTCVVALVPLLKDNETPVSHDVHFSILRPAPEGFDIEMRSEVVKSGKTIAFLKCDAYRVTDAQDILIATGSVTKSIIKNR